jgi:hypothetical protein
VAILSHESYLLIGLPLVCLASMVAVTAKPKTHRVRPYLAAICIPVLVSLALSPLQSLSTDAPLLRSRLRDRLESFGFVPTRTEQVAVGQTTTFIEAFRQQKGEFINRALLPRVWASIGPSLLAFLILIHSSFRIRAFSPFSIVLTGLVFAPLAMHAVAWDTQRISTYLIGGAFIAWWILAETRTASDAGNSFYLVALPAVIVNIFGRTWLMDGEVERFSNPVRVLLYLPTIVFAVAAIVRTLGGDWFKEFREGEFSTPSIDSRVEQC